MTTGLEVCPECDLLGYRTCDCLDAVDCPCPCHHLDGIDATCGCC